MAKKTGKRSKYLPPKPEEFEAALDGLPYEWVDPADLPRWKMRAIDVLAPNSCGLSRYFVRISTTIDPGGGARSYGKKAIRVVLWGSEEDQMVAVDTKILRVDGWTDRLRERVENLRKIARVLGDVRCPKCGAEMHVRMNKKQSKGKTKVYFLGCQRFPGCRGSRDLGRVVRGEEVDAPSPTPPGTTPPEGRKPGEEDPVIEAAITRALSAGDAYLWNADRTPSEDSGEAEAEDGLSYPVGSTEPLSEPETPSPGQSSKTGRTPDLFEEIARAREILSDPRWTGRKEEKACRRLLDSLDSMPPNVVLPIVLGDKTPAGRPTFEARLAELSLRDTRKSKPRKTEKTKAAARRRAGWATETDPDEEEGISEFDRPGTVPRSIRLDKAGTSMEVDLHPTLPKETRPVPGPEPLEGFPYPTLNPVQRIAAEYAALDVNLVVGTGTGTGKTLVGELVGRETIARGGSVAYLSPLKAVSEEKFRDWTADGHPWAGTTAILTGDHTSDLRKSPALREKLKRSRVVVMTSEMLDSKSRRYYSEGNIWLRRVRTLIVDEAHTLHLDGRGDAVEVGLMRFSAINPRARIIFLSATMPNLDEIGGWLTKLNGKPTVTINSSWRPVPLLSLFEAYPASSGYGSYSRNLESLIRSTVDYCRQHDRDKTIVFVHAKKVGRMLVERLARSGIESRFHSADLNRTSRMEIEESFRDGDLRVLVSTSTLAYGVNLPARRVVVVGIHRGLQEVEPLDVTQMIGRAGRPGYDEKGDAIVFLPSDRFEELADVYSTAKPIKSVLSKRATLAFHLVAEIAERAIRTTSEAIAWFGRSLARLQGSLVADLKDVDPEIARGVFDIAALLDQLAERGVLRVADGKYEATDLGRVASWYYFSPLDIADWRDNWDRVLSAALDRNDFAVAWALGATESAEEQYVPRDCSDLYREVLAGVREAVGDEINRITMATIAYSEALSYEQAREMSLFSAMREIRFDVDRILEAIAMVDERVLGCHKEPGWWKQLGLRVRYGVSWEAAELCRIDGVGPKYASAMIDAGISGIADVVAKPRTIRDLFGVRRAKRFVASAFALMKGEQV